MLKIRNGKFSDGDLLYAMTECLDYSIFQYGNSAAWYAQGEHQYIKPQKASATPYGVTDYERYDSEKPEGFWKYYV